MKPVVIPLKLKYRCLKSRGTHKSTGGSVVGKKKKGISIPSTGEQRQMMLVIDAKSGRRKWVQIES